MQVKQFFTNVLHMAACKTFLLNKCYKPHRALQTVMTLHDLNNLL